MGRSRGGFGTKVHAAVNPLGHPVALKLTGCEAAAVSADKGYDSDANRVAIRWQGAKPCIPPRKSRKSPLSYDRHLYRERNVIERFFGRLKQHRRVATRSDKKAANFLGFV